MKAELPLSHRKDSVDVLLLGLFIVIIKYGKYWKTKSYFQHDRVLANLDLCGQSSYVKL